MQGLYSIKISLVFDLLYKRKSRPPALPTLQVKMNMSFRNHPTTLPRQYVRLNTNFQELAPKVPKLDNTSTYFIGWDELIFLGTTFRYYQDNM